MKIPTLLAIFMLLHTFSYAQTAKNKHRFNQAACREVFMDAAIDLPQLYKQYDFDSLQHYTKKIKNECGNTPYIFAIQILSLIERNGFSEKALADTNFFSYLQQYAKTMYQLPKHGQISYMSDDNFDASPYDRRLFGFTKAWAQSLLLKGNLDSTETFLCNVFAGNISKPVQALNRSNTKYPYLDSLVVKSYVIRRNSWVQNSAFTTGVWLPGGNAKVLGVHPAIGLQSGVRNKWNDFALVFSGRFIRTPRDYTVMRNNTIYQRHYFFGGYVGLDYTRYIIHTLHFETGVIAGIGYDGFSIATRGAHDGHHHHANDYLKPLDISSLNLNTGLRLNYFFNPELYLGIAAKYNYINYKNNGGTPMDGNAVSIDFLIGGNF